MKVRNFLSYSRIFKVEKKKWAKYGHLTLPGIFLHKVIPDIDFSDKEVSQCGVPVVKIL